MSPRAFLVITVAAAIALVAAIALLVVEQVAATPPAERGGFMFPELSESPQDIAEMTIETSRYGITIALRDGRWVAADYGDYPVNVQPFGEIVGALLAMTRVEPKTDDPELYRYIGVAGVAEDETGQTTRIAVWSADGTVLADAVFGWPSYSIGFTRIGGSFVRPTDSQQSWLVEGFVSAPTFLQDWFATLLNIPGTEIASVAIAAGDTLLLTAEKVNFDTADYELTFLSETLGPAESTANDANIRTLTQGIISTTFNDARPIGDLTFGDDDRVLRFTTRDGLQLMVRLVELEGEVWVTYQASAAADSPAAEAAAGIAARTDRWAFLIPSHRVTQLSRPVENLFVVPAEPAPAPAPVPIVPLLPPAP